MSGVYSVSVSEEELTAYENGLAESVPKNAAESDFADPPRGLYVGDAKHAALAVQAVTRGQVREGFKIKIGSAVRQFYKGAEQQYYLDWLNTGKKPDGRVSEMLIPTPAYSMDDEARFPDVPLAPGLNLAALTAGDPEPMFITRPLAVLDEVSQNGLPYNKALCDAIYSQVSSGRVVAGLGHIPESEKSSSFPPDAGYWVGAVWNNSVFGKPAVFGKCYIPPGSPLREMARRRMATGAGLSNSVWGDVTWVDGEPVDAQIERVDFVPPERAALQALGGEFKVTSEMKEDPMTDKKDAVEMSLKEMVAKAQPEDLHEALRESGHGHRLAEMHLKAGGCSECNTATMSEMLGDQRRGIAEAFLKEQVTPENTYEMLSPAQRKGVAEAFCKETNQKMTPQEEMKVQETAIAEMRTQLAEVAELRTKLAETTARTTEMEKVIKGYQRADFERDLEAAIDTYFPVQMHTDKGKEGLSNLKRQMRKGSLAEMAGMADGQVPANIKTACDKVWTEDTKALAEMFYSSVGGPSVVVAAPKGPQQGSRLGFDPATGHFTPEFMQIAKDAAAGAQRRRTPGGK
jgi:hypothetical protein